MTLENWMREYSKSHTHPTNVAIHKVCVPLIMFSLLGLMWFIPTPAFFFYPYMNWATLFVLGCLVFYFTLDKKMFIGMFVQSTLMCSFIHFGLVKGIPVFQVSIIVFLLSWIVQIIGHKIEGKKPSFLQDIAFLLIGPLWVLRSFYKKIGIY